MVPHNRIERFLSNPSRIDSTARHRVRRKESEHRGSDRTGYPGDTVYLSNWSVPARSAMSRPFSEQLPSPEEVRLHAALFERLAELRRPRRSLWSKVWGFIRGT
jgi:hypothetical protein